MSTGYSRTAPSPRYQELLSQYVHMHVQGDQSRQIAPDRMFSGTSLPRHAAAIKALIDAHQARTILDYGSGKGLQYKPLRVQLDDGREFPSIPAYWGIESLTCYDPAYEPYNRLPQVTFDGVICTDVLEHCPEDDLSWILSELFAFARRFVYANVACYPAMKQLPTGENAHCTVRSTQWWTELVRRAAAPFPTIRFQFAFDRIERRPNTNDKLISDLLTG